MKKWIARALVLLLLLSAAPSGFCVSKINSAADTFFARLFDKADAVSGAFLVAQDGKRVYEFYFGAEDRRTHRPIGDDTVFKAASVSKMISAMGVMRLFDLGLIDLDAGLTTQDGIPIRSPHFPDAPVTLRQVMSHTSSLRGDAPYRTPPKWEMLTREDKKYFSSHAPGTHYEYSNLNGGILCSVIERISGRSFNTFMAENIFSPLGINAAFAAHLLPDPERIATAYKSDGTVYRRGEQYVEIDAQEYDDSCDPDSHYNASAGSLYISLAGLEKLGIILAGDGTADGVRLLSGYAVRLMRMDQSAAPGSSVTAASPYGLCVTRFTNDDGITWYGHQGRWEGLLTDLFFEPETKTVLVFVLNGTRPSYNGMGLHRRAEDALNYASVWVHAAESSYIVDDE